MKDLTDKISETLKLLRNEKGWSLDVASQNTKVSKAMLGQIERGESSPTIATLWKIVNGFNVSFSTFLKDFATDANICTLKQIHPQDNKIKIMTLFPYDELLKLEIFIIELLPGCLHLSSSHNIGVIEQIITSKGEIEVFIDGVWHKLKEQEGIRFDANKPHGYRNLSSKKAIFHNIIHYSK